MLVIYYMCANKWLISNKIIGIQYEYLKPFNCVQANIKMICIFDFKSSNYIVNWITRKSNEHLRMTYGNTGQLFRPYKVSSAMYAVSPPREIEPGTTDCSVKTVQLSQQFIWPTSDAKVTSHGNCSAVQCFRMSCLSVRLLKWSLQQPIHLQIIHSMYIKPGCSIK